MNGGRQPKEQEKVGWAAVLEPERWAALRGSRKILLLAPLIALLMGAARSAADAHVKATPRFKARVVCFNGKVDSGSSCAGTTFQPDGSFHTSGKMTCGFPGKLSEIEWSFKERHGDKDVYRFTRRFPADTGASTTSSKTVDFSNSRVIVFQDDFQAVVIEPPKK